MAKGKRGGRSAGGGAKSSSRQPAGGVIADDGGDSGESTLLQAPPTRECEPADASPPVAPSGVGHGLLHHAGWTTASPDVTLVHHTHAQGSGPEPSPKLQRWLSRVDAAAVAGHYGSISIVTFVASTQALQFAGLQQEGFMVAVAAAMEDVSQCLGATMGVMLCYAHHIDCYRVPREVCMMSLRLNTRLYRDS